MSDIELLSLQTDHIRTLQQRYEHAIAEQGYDGLLISSGAAPVRYGDDQAWHFQGYGPFLHWTGLTGQEHSWLLIRPGHKPLLSLYHPVDFWHATPELPDEPWLQSMEVRSSDRREAPVMNFDGRLAVVGDPSQLSGVDGEHNPEGLLSALDETRAASRSESRSRRPCESQIRRPSRAS